MTVQATIDVLDMLRAHFGGSQSHPEPGYLLTEVQAPDSDRRADALWVPLMSQLRGQIHGVEVKVSRADLMVELNDPTKADAWLRHCNRWWLAVYDPTWLTGLDIPEHWGILAPPSGRSKRLMTVVRPAPLLHPAGQSAAFATIVTRLFYSGGDTESVLAAAARKTADADARVEYMQRQLREAEEHVRQIGGAGHVQQRVTRVIEHLNGLGGWNGEYRGTNVADEDVARALLDLAALESAKARMLQRIGAVRSDLERVQSSFGRAFDDGLAIVDQVRERIEALS